MPVICRLQGERERYVWRRKEGGGGFLLSEEEWDEFAVAHVGARF